MTERDTTLEVLADPVFLVDEHAQVVSWNRACETAFGLRASEALGRQISGALGSGTDEGFLTVLSRRPAEAEPAFLASIQVRDELWDVRVTPVPSANATAVYCIPASGRLTNWSEILTDSADAIWALDNDDGILAWNRGAAQMFGYRSEEIVGCSLRALIPPDLIEAKEPERLRKALAELGAVRDYETRRVTKDGRELEVSLTRTVLRDASGTAIGSSTIVRDLSQRRQIERQLIESEKMVTLGQLAASVAQEIGAPLTAIGILIEKLQKSGYQNGDDRKQLDTIAQQLSRIARLTRGLVDLAKPGELNLSHFKVDDVIGGALELVETSLLRSGVSVEVQTNTALPVLWGDSGQLQQVCLNLLLNAQRALEGHGGGVVRVTARVKRGFPVEGRPLREAVEIKVSDDGPGIEQADLPFIFAPFFSRSGGSGLGLPLARGIIHAHGGTIDASSTPGAGTTFTILIPVDSDD